MTKTKAEIKMKLCPTCHVVVTFSEKDKVYNTSRLRELAEIRKSTDIYPFKFRGNCETCGVVFVEQNITNVRF